MKRKSIVNVKENSVMHQRAHTRLLAKKLRTTGVIVLSFYRVKSMEILQNMFLLWLSCSFVFEKRDTEGCKSKSQK